MRRLLLAIAAGLVALRVLSPVVSAAPAFWQAATQAEFLRGEVESLSIDEHGRLTLGPSLSRVHDTGAPFVWSMLAAADGSVFLGTGNDGRVFRVDAKGQASVFYDAPELAVHALAAAPNGGLYVATSPDGRIYKVDAKGQATPFFDPEEKYIWGLAVDAQGRVFAATGDPKGRVYRITPDGTGEPFYTSTATHVIALAFDTKGALLAGTESPGRIFRLDAAGKPFLLLDTGFREVRALRVDPQGRIYAVALTGKTPAQGLEERAEPTPDAPRAQPVPVVSTEITSIAIIDTTVASAPQAAPASGASNADGAGAIFRIEADGVADQVWASKEDAPYDVLVEDGGTVLVSTGNRGKLYRLAGNPFRATLLGRADAQQGVQLARSGGRTLVATANPGTLVAMTDARATRGTYTSDVRDARTVATWGTLAWRAAVPAGAKVEIFTRSGNTRTPDEAWSDWAGPYATPTGAAITSPKARYLQWRAVLTATGESPVLTSVSAAYQQRNLRPEVASITVHPPGVVFQKPFSTGEAEIAGLATELPEKKLAQQGQPAANVGGAPSLGRRTWQRGLQTLVWKAQDDNSDPLEFDLQYRREGDITWKPLTRGLNDPIFVWDTSSVPNGTYVVRVLASDRQANAPDAALTGELESESFDVDNTPPAVAIAAMKRDGDAFVVPVTVTDGDSAIQRLEYSLDARSWQPAYPRDGMLDARTEALELRLPADAAGRTLVVRATDALQNVGVGQAVVK